WKTAIRVAGPKVRRPRARSSPVFLSVELPLQVRQHLDLHRSVQRSTGSRRLGLPTNSHPFR
ncbi:hypothetical protein FBU31_006272, partial [Coemansia sp. 'formosensis']